MDMAGRCAEDRACVQAMVGFTPNWDEGGRDAMIPDVHGLRVVLQ